MIFGFLFRLIQLTGTAYLANAVGEKYFPEQTNKFRHFITWQGLKLYTIVELSINKYIKKGKTILDNYFNPCYSKENIHFIYDGIVVETYTFTDLVLRVSQCEPIPECDFVLQFIKLTNHDKFDYNVLRFDNYKDVIQYNKDAIQYNKDANANSDANANNKYTPSPVKFLGLQLNVSNRIIMNFERYNFLMNSNILFDRPFVQYYLYKFHDITLEEHEDYNITFIGVNMEVVMIHDNYIELVDNKYQIR